MKYYRWSLDSQVERVIYIVLFLVRLLGWFCTQYLCPWLVHFWKHYAQTWLEWHKVYILLHQLTSTSVILIYPINRESINKISPTCNFWNRISFFLCKLFSLYIRWRFFIYFFSTLTITGWHNSSEMSFRRWKIMTNKSGPMPLFSLT